MSDVAREATATDLRDSPAYTLAEAARYLKLAPATLRSWMLVGTILLPKVALTFVR